MGANLESGCTVARLLYLTDQELKLHPGSHLGVCHHGDAKNIASASSEVFDSQKVDAVLPDVSSSLLSGDQEQRLRSLLEVHQAVEESCSPWSACGAC